MIVSFGKYKGQLLKDIFNKDRYYIEWLVTNNWYKERHIDLYKESQNLIDNYNINSIFFKEHPLNEYKGIEDSRDWMFDSHENVKSFFSYWKKCKKELKIKNLI